MAEIKIVEVIGGVETTKMEAPLKKVKAVETMTPSQIEALIKAKQAKP